MLTPEAIAVLRLRQIAARASVAKYDALLERADADDLLRHTFQFAGAQRTNRWAGRGFQPTNLARTPPWLADDAWLHAATEAIRAGDLDLLELIAGEPMDTLAGLPRSAIRTDDDEEIRAADLNAIESRVIGWVAKCERINRIFVEKKDPYKDFGSVWFKVPYDTITKPQRNLSKPPVLGCGFGLGGGAIGADGKRTGLWGYAEKNRVEMTQEQAHDAVKVWRETYAEVPAFWRALEDAGKRCIRTGETQEVNEFLRFERRPPYLLLRLPSGRCIFYLQPKIVRLWFAKHPAKKTIRALGQDERRAEAAKAKGWEVYDKMNISYMGKPQNKPGWVRLPTHAGKITENCLSADTLILTPCGAKPIIQIQPSDLVWDGICWVHHSGVVSNGARPVMDFGGVRLTPDHKVDVNGGWHAAETVDPEDAKRSCERYHRLPDTHASSGESGGRRRPKKLLECALRLRKNASDDGRPTGKKRESVLWLRATQTDRKRGPKTRHDAAPGLLGVAVNAGPMPPSDAPVLEELRRERNYGLSALGELVRGILGRRARRVSNRLGFRPDRQQQGVRAGKCQVDDAADEHTKHAAEPRNRHAERQDAAVRSGGYNWNWKNDFVVPASIRLSSGADVRQTQRREPVFDILNAGPHNRFTVIAPDGRPIMVHNCVQAIARDVLKEGMLAAAAEGFDCRLHVYDEIACVQRKTDKTHTVERLAEIMSRPLPWAPGLLLGAAGWAGPFYKKD